jgi:hypothetical protein
LQRDLDCVFAEGDVGQGAVFGIDAGDAADQEVGFGEVEEGRVHEGGDGGGGVDFGFAGCELADLAVGGAVSGWEEGGESGDGDVLGEEVADSGGVVVVFVPDVCFGAELRVEG